jgi:hypothetical protein
MGNIRSMKSAVLAGVILLLGLAAACGGDSNGSSDGSFNVFKSVPLRANLVGTVAVGEAFEALDLELSQFLERVTSDSQDDHDLDELFAIDQFRSGGLFGEVRRADIFAEITDTEDDVAYFGVLLKGSFNEAELIAELESIIGTDLAATVYKGTNVYSSADDEEEFELSVLDSSTFVLGAGGAINDIIDIRAGDAEPKSGGLAATLAGLDGGLFALAAEVPQDIGSDSDLGSFSQLGDLPISLDFISALKIIGISGELDGGSLDLIVTMDFTDEESAESLANFIGGIVTLASGFLTDPNAAGLLEGLKVDREGTLLTLDIGIPVADLPDLFGDLNPFNGIESSSSSGTSGRDDTPEIRVLQAAIGKPVPVLVNINHVAEGQRVDYQDAPPSSGQHWSTPAGCGFYTESLPDERIVHNMEHGNVVVSYNFTNPAQTTELREALDDVDQFDEWGVARPYDRIPDGQVSLTAWGRVHTMAGVNPEEIELFFEAFAGSLGPERFTC